jgi:hypothetical protein
VALESLPPAVGLSSALCASHRRDQSAERDLSSDDNLPMTQIATKNKANHKIVSSNSKGDDVKHKLLPFHNSKRNQTVDFGCSPKGYW